MSKERIYVPNVPREEPSLTPGRRFFCFDDSLHGLLTPEGKPAPDEEVSLSVLVLRVITPDSLTFSSEDGAKTYRLPRDGRYVNSTSLPGGIYPVLDDSEADSVRARYEGKIVWHYPGFRLNGRVYDAWFQPPYTGFTASYDFSSATVRRVVRLRLPGVTGTDGGGEVRAWDPLIMLFDAPSGFRFAHADGPSLWNMSGESRDVLFRADSGKVRCFALFAGAWEVDRSLTLVSPKRAREGWSVAARSAISAAEHREWAFRYLRKGMTPDMVAWLMGWPPGYATRDELRRQSKWTYRGWVTGDVSVFFRNGRVFKWVGREVLYESWNPP